MSLPSEHYAIRIAPDRGITVQVFPQGRARFHAKLIDEWDNTLALVYSPWGDADLREGDVLGLQLSLSETSDSLWFEGTVERVEPEELFVRAEIKVTSGDVRNKLDDGAWAIFNRRRRPRVHFGGTSAITASLTNESGAELAVGRLYDVSVSGLCVRLERFETAALSDPGPLHARFELPDTGPILVRARIRDVRVGEDQLLFGMSIEREEDDLGVARLAEFVSRSII